MAKKIIAFDDAATGTGLPTDVETKMGGRFLTKTEASATYAPAFPASQTIAYTDGNVTSVTEDGITTTYTYNPDGTVDTDTRQGVTRKYTYTDGNLTGIEVL